MRLRLLRLWLPEEVEASSRHWRSDRRCLPRRRTEAIIAAAAWQLRLLLLQLLRQLRLLRLW